MLEFFVLLVMCQLAGELVRVGTGAPLSGPVIGMALLFGLLTVLGRLPSGLKETSQSILQHLALLFVPASVGIVVHASRLRDEWLAIGAALIGSTVITVAVTALTMRALLRRSDSRRHAAAASQLHSGAAE
jgi:holin-like protein